MILTDLYSVLYGKVVFEKEKEYLRPLNSEVLLDSYIKEHHQTAPIDSTLLFAYKGHRYSVPVSYMGKILDIYPIDNVLYVYFRKKLVCTHAISSKPVIYDPEHYREALKARMESYMEEDKIEEMAKANLERFDQYDKR